MRLHTAVSWPGRVFAYPGSHIRWKIIAPYALLTVAIALAGTYLVTRLVAGSLDERFNNQLAEAGRVASDSLVRTERGHLEAVRAIAFTEGVPDAAATGNPFVAAALAQPIVANGGLERVEVLTSDGDRIYAAQRTDGAALEYAQLTDADDPSSWPIVQSVLAGGDAFGDKYTAIVETSARSVLYTAGPIYVGEVLSGVVLVGTTLESALGAAKSEALADVTVYDESGAPIATTFASFDGNDASTLVSRPAGGADESLLREHKTLFGRDYDLLYAPLEIRGEPVAVLSVGLPSSFIFSAQATTRAQMMMLFTAAMIVALLVGWLIARSITRPVFKLVSAARAVSSGNLAARSNVSASDEIGTLGRAFDAMTERLQRQHLSTVRALTSAIDARDPYTMGHSLRVGQLAVALGKDLNLTEAQLQHLEIGGYLHDIGKIGVRDDVLLKPGALTDAERVAIEQHPRIGMNILEHVDLAPEVLAFVGAHHERLDGTGYPNHLSGDELSVIPRVATVADIYDGLTTDRPYRAGMTPDEALDILRTEAIDDHVDWDVVEALERVWPHWEERRRSEPNLRGFTMIEAEAA